MNAPPEPSPLLLNIRWIDASVALFGFVQPASQDTPALPPDLPLTLKEDIQTLVQTMARSPERD